MRVPAWALRISIKLLLKFAPDFERSRCVSRLFSAHLATSAPVPATFPNAPATSPPAPLKFLAKSPATVLTRTLLSIIDLPASYIPPATPLITALPSLAASLRGFIGEGLLPGDALGAADPPLVNRAAP